MYSVLLATYNGTKYVIEQIDSIIKQTIPVDNIYIYDDCSTDETISVIEKYIHDIHLNNVFTRKNKNNKGYTKNFLNALFEIEDDFVFLCDQDDFWVSTKVQEYKKVIESMKTDSPILITSAYSITDEKLQVIENKHINKEVIRINENSFVKDCSFPGMTFCVNKKLIQLAKEKYDEAKVFYHDYFLSLLAINYGEMFCVGTSTVLYRQHMNNQLGSGGRGKENRTHWKKVLQQKENEMIMVNAFSKNAVIYEKKSNFSLKRKNWFENRKIYCVIFNLFNYLRFYNMKSFLADLYYCVRK